MPVMTEQEIEFLTRETWAEAMRSAAWAARNLASSLPNSVSGREALTAFADTCDTLNRQDAENRGEGSA